MLVMYSIVEFCIHWCLFQQIIRLVCHPLGLFCTKIARGYQFKVSEPHVLQSSRYSPDIARFLRLNKDK